MSSHGKNGKIREVIGIFFNASSLEKAVKDLYDNGFKHSEVGMLAGKFTVQQKLGHLYQEVNSDIGSPDAPDTAFVAKESVGDTFHALIGTLYVVGAAVAGGAIVVSAGIFGPPLAVAAATTAVFGGVGALLGYISSESDAEYLEEQVEEGHLLLLVRVENPAREKLAVEILSRDCAFNPKVYDV